MRRIFWSVNSATDCIQYQCTICDNSSAPEFVISYENGQEIREISASGVELTDRLLIKSGEDFFFLIIFLFSCTFLVGK